MLHGTIRNDDFERYTALQCWNNVATIRDNVATMLRCERVRTFLEYGAFVWTEP